MEMSQTLDTIVRGILDNDKQYPKGTDDEEDNWEMVQEKLNNVEEKIQKMNHTIHIDKENNTTNEYETNHSVDVTQMDNKQDGEAVEMITASDTAVTREINITIRKIFTQQSRLMSDVKYTGYDVTPANQILTVPSSLKGIFIVTAGVASLLCVVLVLIAVLCVKRKPKREYVDIANDFIDDSNSSFSDHEPDEVGAVGWLSFSSDDIDDCTDYDMDNEIDNVDSRNIDNEIDTEFCAEMNRAYWLEGGY
ncbi:hypothetical protein CAPTEDRAFT_186979 [Capitella teleta]|uniref:Uncharacterized protein n=1 Tax=Capitella teleta TaxID=283909 RepID=R7VLT2_CAPTE|nr:hypothetical protein CAPTEDRAFT_186979 [Capitella teleta]|eukprot:ELU18546.1 hypothetical protein CAPTEDRAFT_186979 [Capitella teleta]